MGCMTRRTFALSALQGGEGGDPSRSDGEGEVGIGERSGIPHLTPTLSALKGGEGEIQPVPRQRALIIVNPMAGQSRSSRRRLDRVVAALKQRGCAVVVRHAGPASG